MQPSPLPDGRARSSDPHARRVALVACAINAIGSPLDLLIDPSLHLPVWPPLLASLVGVVLFVLVWRKRSRGWAEWAFLVNNAAVAGSLWVGNSYYAEEGSLLVPFQGSKLAMFIVAVLAPRLWVGVLSIWTHAAVCVVQYSLFDGAARAHVTASETRIVIVFALVTTALLAFQTRAQRFQEQAAVALAEAVSLRRLTRAQRLLRHQANTPLQTLAFITAHLKAEHPELGRVLARQERAVARLQEAAGRVVEGENEVPWGTAEGPAAADGSDANKK